MYVSEFIERGLFECPEFVKDNIVFEAFTGSRGFNINTDKSDYDITAVVVPPREIVFPYESPYYICGVGQQPTTYKHTKTDKFLFEGNEFEITIYSISRFFDLCLKNSPTAIEFLFSSMDSVTLQSGVACLFREHRKMFLSKLFYNQFVGYAVNEINSINKFREYRADLFEKFGYDTKSAANALRLLCETKQIVEHGDLDVQKKSDFLREVRAGKYPINEITECFKWMKEEIEILEKNSKLQSEPNEKLIKELFLRCVNTYWNHNG